jgi:hypothetical protein
MRLSIVIPLSMRCGYSPLPAIQDMALREKNMAKRE